VEDIEFLSGLLFQTQISKIGFGRKNLVVPSMCSHLGQHGTGYTTLVRDKSCYWKCHKEHIGNLGNMMGTLWKLDQNTIENLGNLLGTH